MKISLGVTQYQQPAHGLFTFGRELFQMGERFTYSASGVVVYRFHRS
jgi:hypothetical protein